MSACQTNTYKLPRTLVFCQESPVQKSSYITFRLSTGELQKLCNFFEKHDRNTDSLICQLILVRACTPSLQTVPLADIIDRLPSANYGDEKQANDSAIKSNSELFPVRGYETGRPM